MYILDGPLQCQLKFTRTPERVGQGNSRVGRPAGLPAVNTNVCHSQRYSTSACPLGLEGGNNSMDLGKHYSQVS